MGVSRTAVAGGPRPPHAIINRVCDCAFTPLAAMNGGKGRKPGMKPRRTSGTVIRDVLQVIARLHWQPEHFAHLSTSMPFGIRSSYFHSSAAAVINSLAGPDSPLVGKKSGPAPYLFEDGPAFGIDRLVALADLKVQPRFGPTAGAAGGGQHLSLLDPVPFAHQ